MLFESESQIDQLVADFESGSLPKAAWTHQVHVAVAGAIAWQNPQAALSRMRAGIRFLNDCHGTANMPTSGYHET